MTTNPKIGSKCFFGDNEIPFGHKSFDTVHITTVYGQCQARNWKIGIFLGEIFVLGNF